MIYRLTSSKKWFVLFLFVTGLFWVNGQSVDSIQHNGEQYYVYPFRKNVSIHRDYWKIVDDEAFFADYNNYFNRFNGDFLFSREKFQDAKTQKRKDELQAKLEEKWKQIKRGRRYGKTATRTIRNNPGELIEVSYYHEQDLLPPFGTIPDGKYVQLFEDFCLVDENGKCQSDAYQIAGYFTIKNNVIDGAAVWLDFKGDTLKKGSFVNGLKEGEWEIRFPDELSYLIRGNDRKQLRKGESIPHQYGHSYSSFKNGLNHGPYRFDGVTKWQQVVGEYDMGEVSGEWIYKTNSQITFRAQMANAQDTIVSKKPLLRNFVMQRPRNYRVNENGKLITYDISCRDAAMPNFPSNFYEIQFEQFDDELELEGENDKSMDLTDARRYRDYDEFTNNYNSSYQDATEVDASTGRSYPRWFVMDSLGARMKYEGVYEQYYLNGQLFFRYEFKNGHLLSEDTLFWDNGTPMDVIVFEADSNKYYRSLYDRNGDRYDVMIYDSIGAFIEYYTDEPIKNLEITIDGLVAEENRYLNRGYFEIEPVGFFYADYDTLGADSILGKVVLSRTWSVSDTTIQTNVEYDPRTYEYISEKYNFFGEVHARETKIFTEDFSGWTGTDQTNYGDLMIKGTRSGVRRDLDEIDTLKHRSVNYPWNIYDVTSDVYLYQNNEPFTGDFKYKASRITKVKATTKKVDVRYSKAYSGYGRFYRARKKKKSGKRFMLESLTNDIGLQSASSQVSRDFFEYFVGLVYNYDTYMEYSASDSKFGIKSVEGRFLDGKPQGEWNAFDSKGKVLSTVSFNKGEVDGELRLYNYQDKEPKYGYGFWNFSDNLDTFPKHRTRYLEHSVQFKNGMREGLSVQYDWLGRIVMKGEFKDGQLNGKLISRDPESHTEATFKDGALDGYLKTYLTLPRRDSILLYDINLQHGLLNGESKSYHTNGRLAKRGFFLDGEPIEDYEAYDTLGFNYHYVKFQYGMPIEEKIWEENALSIRYKFNWEDSIAFYPEDITSTQSVEALLVKEGYNSYSIEDRYYGRVSLISKEGIDCHMTKYYPNDTVARDGMLKNKQKIGLWKFYGYNGGFLYEANYFDSVIVVNDSVKFKSKGILTDYDDAGNRLYSSYIIEKFEKYDCAHTDHYETRQLITIDEENDSTNRMNGYVFNFYDNGTIQSEGAMKNGIPDGLWKFYDPFGKLNKMGNYLLGKRNGRWLEGDLAKKKYLGEICMNPNLPDLEKQQKYQENLLDITIINYVMGKLMNTQFYDVNMNKILEIEESKGE